LGKPAGVSEVSWRRRPDLNRRVEVLQEARVPPSDSTVLDQPDTPLATTASYAQRSALPLRPVPVRLVWSGARTGQAAHGPLGGRSQSRDVLVLPVGALNPGTVRPTPVDEQRSDKVAQLCLQGEVVFVTTPRPIHAIPGRHRRVSFEKSPVCDAVDPNEQGPTLGGADKGCPERRVESRLVVEALGPLVGLELLAVATPKVVWSTPRLGPLVLVTEKADIGWIQAGFLQDRSDHSDLRASPTRRYAHRRAHARGWLGHLLAAARD